MKNRTIVVILVLSLLLFLEIEAANTGILILLKQNLSQNLSVPLVVGFLVLVAGLGLGYFAFFDKSLNLKEGRKQDRSSSSG